MIFPRMRMWGGFVNLEPKREKPMCHFPLFYPNYLHLIISASSWEKLWQLIVLGVGWQDCQSSPTRTLHQQGTLTPSHHRALPPRFCVLPSSRSAHIHAQAYLVSLMQTFTLSTTLLLLSHFQFRVLSVGCSSSRRSGSFSH